MDTTSPPSRFRFKAVHSLWFFVLLSLILHFTGFLPVVLKRVLPKAEPPKPAAEPAPAPPPTEAEWMAQQRESTEALLKAALENIAGEVDQTTLDQLWEEMELDFSQFESPELDSMAAMEMYSQLTAEMFSQASASLKEMLRAELKQATREQVEEFSVDKLAQDLDKRMEEQLGSQEEKQWTLEAQRDTARRRQELLKDTQAVRRMAENVAKNQEKLAEQTAEEEKKEVTDSQRKQSAGRQQKVQQQLTQLQESVKTLKETHARDLPEEALPEAELAQAAREQNEAQAALKEKQPAAKDMKQAAESLKQGADKMKKLVEAVEGSPKIDLEAREAMKALVDGELKQEIQESFDDTLANQLAPEGAEILTRQAQKFFKEFGLEDDAELEEELKQALAETIAKTVPLKMKDQAGQLAMNKTEQALKLDEVEAAEQALARQSPPTQKPAQNEQVQREVNRATRAVDLGDMSGRMEELKDKLGMQQRAEQMAESFREGRANLGDLGSMAAMMEFMQEGGARGNMPPGRSLPFGLPIPGGSGAFNPEVFNKLLEMSEARKDPDAVYPEIERQAEQMVSRAGAFPEQRVAKIIDPQPAASGEASPEEADEERKMVQPSFQPIKFGWASMVREKPVLDGKLDEWDADRFQYASIQNRGTDNPLTLPEPEAVRMALQWDHDGLYIAADVPNDQKKAPTSPAKFWEGDSIEVWLDTSDIRGPLMTYFEAIQMWFHPYPSQSNPEARAGFGHGYRMRDKPGSGGMFLRGQEDGLQMAMQERPGGYTVEMFIPQQGVLKGPRFKAGKYLGFQISFNHSRGGDSVSWVMRGHHTWERPDTWGDLLLLGSDAEIGFFKDEALEKPLEILVPGEPFWVKVHDPDMNLDPRYKDQVIVRLSSAFGHEEGAVLGETGPDTGVFAGGIETSNIYAGYREGFLPVEPGKAVTVTYLDQRRDYGETHQRVQKELPSAWPTLRLGKNP